MQNLRTLEPQIHMDPSACQMDGTWIHLDPQKQSTLVQRMVHPGEHLVHDLVHITVDHTG